MIAFEDSDGLTALTKIHPDPCVYVIMDRRDVSLDRLWEYGFKVWSEGQAQP